MESINLPDRILYDASMFNRFYQPSTFPLPRMGRSPVNIRFVETPVQNLRNGNVVTSERWRRFLEQLGHRVSSSSLPWEEPCDLLVVFNAYKNRQAIIDARKNRIARSIVICLTGTDLYLDLKNDPAARDVLHLADQLVVLQPMAFHELPAELRKKTMVIFQSAAPPSFRGARDPESFDVCVIAHLRDVKDPLRTAQAARLLPAASRIRLFHVGKALSEDLAREVAREVEENPRFHWLGEQSGEQTAKILVQSRLLVLSSLLEGGANVVSEAIVSGIPVIGTDIPCMKGLLGEDYPGLFPVKDTGRLAELLFRAETDRAYYEELEDRCRQESHKFDPALERENLRLLLERACGTIRFR
jgi:putative glycosyltransferase (TIGR04348 family)